MQKRVDFYTYPHESSCEEVRQFLETQDLDLRVRDLTKQPLNYDELARLIRHIDIKHFINVSSKAYKKHQLDKELPERKKIITFMAEDNDLVRKPIIIAGRLMTVGCNRQKIMEMLQIKSNGSDPNENGRNENGRHARS